MNITNKRYNPIAILRKLVKMNSSVYNYMNTDWAGVLEDLPKFDYNDKTAQEICHMVIMDLLNEKYIKEV